MKNKVFLKAIAIFIMICTVLTSFSLQDLIPIEAEAAETNYGTHYRLDTGIYYIWKHSNDHWQNDIQKGSDASSSVSLTIPPNAQNVEVFAYKPDGVFNFNSFDNFHWNYTPAMSNIADNKESYIVNYYEKGAYIGDVRFVSYDETTGKLSYSYDIKLTTNVPNQQLDIKYLLSSSTGKQTLKDYIGEVTPDVQKSMNLLDPTSETYNSNVEGYAYFIPIVIKYDLLPNNNLEMISVDFYDMNGDYVTEPFMGNAYKVRYTIKYTGEDMTSPINVIIQNGHIRNKKSGTNDYWTSNWSKSKTVQLKDGESFYIEVGPFDISEPSIYANATIKYDSRWNPNTDDDYGEKEILGMPENLVLNIESITPSVTQIYAPQSQVHQNYELIYTVNFLTPKKDAQLVTDIVLNLHSNSNTNPSSLEIKDYIQLVPGLNRFFINTGSLDVRNYNGSFDISLEVNKSRNYPTYESNFTDNRDTIRENIQTIPQVANPCVGEINRANPSWEVTYNISTATGWELEVGYHGTHRRCVEYSDPDENGRTHCTEHETYPCTCSRCVGGTVDDWSQTSTRTEDFEITNINFTSKDSGKINLLNRNGLIKAGYGFDLEIIAKYIGTERPSRPATWGGCNYQRVNPGPYQLGSIPNNIYVILPDGQYLSNRTSVGITNLMDCVSTSNGSAYKTLRCQVKLGNTFGNKETRKLYIDENTADGKYDITVCTAKFNGVSPRATKPLFDRRKVTFEVKGKHIDDLSSHIVQ